MTAALTAVLPLACSDGDQWQDRETLKNIQDNRAEAGGGPAGPKPAEPAGPAPETLLDSARIPGMAAEGLKTYPGPALSDYIDGEAELYFAFGFVSLATAKVTPKDGKPARVNVYLMSSPLAAFGVFTQYSDPESHAYLGGTRANGRPGAADFLKGPYFVQVRPEDEDIPSEAMASIGFKVLEPVEGEALDPPQFKTFPQEGRVRHSERYFADDYLGVKGLSQVFECTYRKGETEFKAFASCQKDAAAAAALFKTASALLAKDATRETEKAFGRDRHDRLLYFRTKGSALLGCVNPPAFEDAADVIEKTAAGF